MKADDPNSRKRLSVYDDSFPSANFNSDESCFLWYFLFLKSLSLSLFFKFIISYIVQPSIS